MLEDIGELADPDTLPTQLGEEQRETLAALMAKSRQSLPDSPKSSHKIDTNVCKVMREMKESGVPVEEILDYVPAKSPNTVYYHINDKCSHDRRVQVTYSECGWMRAKASNGKTSAEIADEYNLAQKNARMHILGKCSHEDGIEPVSPDVLRANAYPDPPTVTTTCPVCGTDFQHREYNNRTTCSEQCNVEYASIKSAKQRASDD
jgi:hypothetical protein